jgi:hypothetical protein
MGSIRKNKGVPSYSPGGIMALGEAVKGKSAGVAQGVMGVGQAIYGMKQAKEARRAIKELQKNQPSIEVPPALRKLALEPIAEDYVNMQEIGAQRRTSQSIDALGKGGGRGLGNVASVLENERVGEMQRAGEYGQARNKAMTNLARAEERTTQLRLRNYLNDLNAARGSLEAGEQNIFTGAGQAVRGAMGVSNADEGGGASSTKKTLNQREVQEIIPTDPKGLNFDFENGGIMRTKGQFSHRKNPKFLVDGKSGKVEAELTGSETVFNEKDSKAMEKLANGDAKQLQKFVKGKYKAFNTRRKNQK